MLQTAYKVTKTRNEYGDYEGTDKTAIYCKFREITRLVDGLADTVESDAMAWFEPDSGVIKGDVIEYENTLYKVEKLTNARTLRSTQVLFIKTELNRYKNG